MVNYPKYVIKRATNSQFFWVLKSINAETLITSETYVSKQGALDGIASSKRNTLDSNFIRKASTGGQPYFTQNSTNWQVLGASEMYSSVQNRENGIAAVKRDAPIAGIEDLT